MTTSRAAIVAAARTPIGTARKGTLANVPAIELAKPIVAAVMERSGLDAAEFDDLVLAESPYGATIAHGFLTLSLIPGVSKDNYRVENAKMGINYGLNKVRFLSAVTAGSRIRVRSELADATKVADDTVNLTVRHTVEIDGVDKPAAVAELIARFVW